MNCNGLLITIRLDHRVETGMKKSIRHPEFTLLWQLNKAEKYKALLNHPLVTSFLMLKWHTIRSFYFINVTIYTLHVLFLSIYIWLLNYSDLDNTVVRRILKRRHSSIETVFSA